MKKYFFLILTAILLSSCDNNDDNISHSDDSNDDDISHLEKKIEIKVMSFNIRLDRASDGDNNWRYRKDVAAKAIKDEEVDLLGTQEVLENQLNDLKERLPEYKALGVGREDSIHQGEHSAIFYKKNRFEELDTGNFWLSETPNKVSIGWDAALERIATWVILKEKGTGKELLFMNTHLDHKGRKARQKSVTLLLDRAADLGEGRRIILSGDFNAGPESSVVEHITDEGETNHLHDSRALTYNREGNEGTIHNFSDVVGDRIDYVFLNDKIVVKKYKTLPKKLNGIFLSDHMPIVVNLTF